ncbi:MAG: hypothetical protein EOM07_05165 [Clostridia bacterium]|nr:hypothetical protein [Clostridia bacterium]
MARKPQTVKPIKLSAAQKEEIRRLTQQVNRRIAAAMKLYESKGLTVAPYEVTGGIQERSQWATEKYAVSRSVKFGSVKEYKDQLKWLKSFKESKKPRPTITDYAVILQDKTIMAIETMLGGQISESLTAKIRLMNAAELQLFWKEFSDLASKLALDYSSEAMVGFSAEYFQEDVNSLIAVVDTMGEE